MSEGLDWLNMPVPTPDNNAEAAAIAHQNILTKPQGALGRLEEIAIHLAALQGQEHPQVNKVQISVFVGDHGIAEEGVSAFPQAVTAEMVKNFARGGAAISVAAKTLNADLEVINLGTAFETGVLENVKSYHLGPGTANFAKEPAMTEHQLSSALAAGRHAAERAQLAKTELFIGGEMGIANTTSTTALACALLDIEPEKVAGPGTGLDKEGVNHKAAVIKRAIEHHNDYLDSPLEILRRLGGFEIAALTGAYISCAYMRMPILVDGFISSAAALTAVKIRPDIEPWLLFSHQSAEPGHKTILEALDAKPLLDIGMRLGEGSGAATVVPLLRMACALHNEMATFAEAEVSEKI